MSRTPRCAWMLCAAAWLMGCGNDAPGPDSGVADAQVQGGTTTDAQTIDVEIDTDAEVYQRPASDRSP
jgi:hypothetical protein